MALERRIALLLTLLIVGLVGCLTALISGGVSHFEKVRLRQNVLAIERLYSTFEDERFRALETETRLLADLPQIRAVLMTRDILTISDTLSEFKKLIHADDLRSQEVAQGVAQTATSTHYYEYRDGLFWQTVSVNVFNNGVAIARLTAFRRFGIEELNQLRDMTRSHFVLFSQNTSENKLILSTSPEITTSLLREKLEEQPELRDTWVAAALSLKDSHGLEIGKCAVFAPLSEGLVLASRLKLNLIALAILFGFVAIAMGIVFARSITKPLHGLVRKLDKNEELTESEIGTDKQVSTLLNHFRELKLALKVEKEKSHAMTAAHTEALERRILAVEGENGKLVESNKALMRFMADQEFQSKS